MNNCKCYQWVIGIIAFLCLAWFLYGCETKVGWFPEFIKQRDRADSLQRVINALNTSPYRNQQGMDEVQR